MEDPTGVPRPQENALQGYLANKKTPTPRGGDMEEHGGAFHSGQRLVGRWRAPRQVKTRLQEQEHDKKWLQEQTKATDVIFSARLWFATLTMSSEFGTYKAVKAIFGLWLSGQGSKNLLIFFRVRSKAAY